MTLERQHLGRLPSDSFTSQNLLVGFQRVASINTIGAIADRKSGPPRFIHHPQRKTNLTLCIAKLTRLPSGRRVSRGGRIEAGAGTYRRRPSANVGEHKVSGLCAGGGGGKRTFGNRRGGGAIAVCRLVER
jgi:hypothetical protein